MIARVKICGVTTKADALAAARAGADAIGIVFAPSPRRVTSDDARRIAAAVGPFVTVVGVFVNPTMGMIERVLRRCHLQAIQLHGEEPPELVARVGQWLPVIKAVRLTTPDDLRRLRAFRGVAAFLCDAAASGRWGGSGLRCDWTLAAAARRCGLPVILAGGLTPANVVEAVRRVRPYGVDISSGVEQTPGRKDPALIRAFIRRATRALGVT